MARKMGGGASSRKDSDASSRRSSATLRRGSWGDVPITFADVQLDGVVEHRLDEKAIRHRGSISSNYGRISSKHQVFASQAARVLVIPHIIHHGFRVFAD